MSTAAHDLTMSEPMISALADQIAKKLSVSPIQETITFGELYRHWFEKHVMVKHKNAANAKYFYSAHGPRWENVQIHQMRRKDIQAWVDELGQESQSAATRALNMVSAIINWGIKRELVPAMDNPCKGVDRFQIASREKFLVPQELVVFNLSLNQEPPVMRDFFHLCLFTGARRGNVLAMKWADIDFDLATWTISAAEFKNGASHIIPLTQDALDALLRRRKTVNNSPWVFHSRSSASGHMEDPKGAFRRICQRAGLKNVRIHDLRRTLASYMAMGGSSPYAIARMLGHRDMRATTVYARLDVGTVRDAAQAVHERWQNILALPVSTNALGDQTGEANQAARFEDAKEPLRLPCHISKADQIQIEAKIIMCLKSGGSTKSDFYSKLGSQFKVRQADMSRILEEMQDRQLIGKSLTDGGYFRYSLV